MVKRSSQRIIINRRPIFLNNSTYSPNIYNVWTFLQLKYRRALYCKGYMQFIIYRFHIVSFIQGISSLVLALIRYLDGLYENLFNERQHSSCCCRALRFEHLLDASISRESMRVCLRLNSMSNSWAVFVYETRAFKIKLSTSNSYL
jgi:hypothetical protein